MVERETLENAAPAEQKAPEAPVKRPFVAPTISVPVDVLEATTFFQSTESGATN